MLQGSINILTQIDQQRLCAFERNILRKIYVPVQEKSEWRIRYNRKMYWLYRSLGIIRTIRADGCDGQVAYKERATMKYSEESLIQNWQAAGEWKDDAMKYLRELVTPRWSMVARHRHSWKRVLRNVEDRFGP